ncbi:NAD(P)/FAD-dependent oxidoreductase [Fodinibius sp. AD559]|uniref:NAD(P)/FAD-dependent oxidoreductase n=1 Tax=Fodinibius sp. AD559 TaxID=3424179 RepID=UPI004046CB9E
MPHHTDYCILGAGIAGLSLADALSDYDLSSVVIEKNSIGSGASGTPGGLVNPATGRRAKKTWKAEQSYESIAANLEKVQSHSDTRFYRNNGLLRPALLKKMARKMKEQYENTTWPDGWCQWKSKEEIQKIHPGVKCVDGGLWLPIGLTVDIGSYIKAYGHYLENNGINIVCGEQPYPISEDGYWLLELDEITIKADHLVFATGHTIATSPFWDWIPLELIKGQVAKFKKESSSLSFSHSISSLGYIARLDEEDTFIQGSTYEHDFTHLNPDAEGESYLRKRMRRSLPQLEKQSKLVDQWAGVRISTPNYKPILGLHPAYSNLHLFSGLGSKGLLLGKFLAEHYADHLTNGTPLYPEIDINRFT